MSETPQPKTKSQFRIGSIHGRVNYSQNERVFHESEASPETRAAVNLIKTSLTAGRLHGGMYRITEARELPQYISNNDAANYTIGYSSNPSETSTHRVVGSILTNAPTATQGGASTLGVVRDMVCSGSTGTGSMDPAWVGEDDKARTRLAR